jgi:hypothetical protein
MAAKKQKIVYRSAVDGEFTTKKEAERKPREHIKQHVPVGKQPKKK